MLGASKREFSAELLGTFVLMAFGLAVNAQVTLGQSTNTIQSAGAGGSHVALTQYAHGDFLSVNIGWGLAVLLGVYVAGGITGAHINPAVTLAMAFRRELPWAKVVPFIAAQMLGSFIASMTIYAVYREAIVAIETQSEVSASLAEMAAAEEHDAGSVAAEVGTAALDATAGQARPGPRHKLFTSGIWSTYPREFANGTRLSNWSGFLDQVVATALLLLCICAITDSRNMAPASNLGPLAIGGIVFLIGLGFGSNCGYAINPARDFAPRLFAWMAGWGSQVFVVPNNTWDLVPIVGPLLGGVLGVVVYDQLISRFHPRDEGLTKGAE
jgi:glycerol uptake facilitator protein